MVKSVLCYRSHSQKQNLQSGTPYHVSLTLTYTYFTDDMERNEYSRDIKFPSLMLYCHVIKSAESQLTLKMSHLNEIVLLGEAYFNINCVQAFAIGFSFA